MGCQMDDLDIDNIMNDLDYNKDRLISADEFHIWWLAGRKGATGTMAQMIAQGLGGNHFFKTANETMKRLAK
jgi:hypothetical protein